MKIGIKILIAIVAVVVVLAFAKDVVIKMAVEKGVEVVTGLKLNIGMLNVGVLKPIVNIRNLLLLNPPDFPDRNMIDMPEIYVDYDLPAIMGGKIHLPELRLNLKEFTVVKNARGKLNLDSLTSVQQQKSGKAAAGKAPEIQIDSLKLTIGRVIYKDYSKGGAPDIKTFDINLSESYTNVTNPYSLASLIVVKALMNTTIPSLANFDIKGLQGTIGNTLANAQKMAATATAQAKAVTETAAKTAEEAKTAVTETTQAVKDIFKNPFGSNQ